MSNNTNNTEMNNLAMEEEDEGEIFLGESDVLREIDVDEEGFFLSPSIVIFLSYVYMCMCM